jgi:hypothetical protein
MRVMKALQRGMWRRLTYPMRLRRHYKRWMSYGLDTGLALRRAREDCS